MTDGAADLQDALLKIQYAYSAMAVISSAKTSLNAATDMLSMAPSVFIGEHFNCWIKKDIASISAISEDLCLLRVQLSNLLDSNKEIFRSELRR